MSVPEITRMDKDSILESIKKVSDNLDLITSISINEQQREINSPVHIVVTFDYLKRVEK